ncbi:hypothetical protein E1263_06170 [Kribbella antibiotica]|uniref:Uncharacterized protein n=1 Tax=Kribbella antibiotica TaxID=190195 RepID=A0A4R4ZSJ5_9ACTN|nr:hypothetical protein [Kribbella antibiotica]TDD61775.1 hypothetical protein E1263_06170 [Kribbella antibiotica]
MTTGGTGDLDMSVDDAPTMLNMIEVPIKAWDKEWKTLKRGISADEGKVQGFDDISKQFRENYNAVEPGLTERADGLVQKISPAVATGRKGVAIYKATLENMTDRLNNIT